MDNQTLISRYQDKFGDKELTFWCDLQIMWEVYSIGHTGYNDNEEEPYYITKWWREQKKIEPYRITSKTYPIDKIIWHKLTRGRLIQEVEYTATNDAIMPIIYMLEFNLKARRILDKTIYDRVEVEEIKTILLEIMTKRDD